MRTTLSIDDDLLERARRRAAALRLSLSEVINRALRRGLANEPAQPAGGYQTITFGTPGAPFPSDGELRRFSQGLDDDHWTGKLQR